MPKNITQNTFINNCLVLVLMAGISMFFLGFLGQHAQAAPARCFRPNSNGTNATMTCPDTTDTPLLKVTYSDGGPKDVDPALCYLQTGTATDVGSVFSMVPTDCAEFVDKCYQTTRNADGNAVTEEMTCPTAADPGVCAQHPEKRDCVLPIEYPNNGPAFNGSCYVYMPPGEGAISRGTIGAIDCSQAGGLTAKCYDAQLKSLARCPAATEDVVYQPEGPKDGFCYIATETDNGMSVAPQTTYQQTDCSQVQQRIDALDPNKNPPIYTPGATCDGSTDAQLDACLANNATVIWLGRITNFLAGGAALIITIMIIIGGIQYSSSNGNPQAVGAAKTKIINAIIALFVFFFMYGILQYLIPGGIFG